MAIPLTFDDPVLGSVSWDDANKCWNFRIGLLMTHVDAIIGPEHGDGLPSQPALEQIRSRILWIIQNEIRLRDEIADRMFPLWMNEWRNPAIDKVSDLGGFRNAIGLSLVDITNDKMTLWFNPGELFGGHSITQRIPLLGEFDLDPWIEG